LRQAKGLTCHKPEGAFYVFPNMRACIGKTTSSGKKIGTDTDFVTALLEEKARRHRAGCGLRHEPLLPHLLRHRHGEPARGCRRIQEFCGELI